MNLLGIVKVYVTPGVGQAGEHITAEKLPSSVYLGLELSSSLAILLGGHRTQ